NRTERLVQAIESLGSGQIRSLTFRGSWAILGVKGAIPGSVPEGRTASLGGPVTLTDTVLFQSIQGSFTTLPFGPAKTWTDMFLEVDTSVAGTHVSLDVLRLHRNGVADTVYSVSFERDSVINLLQDSVRTVQFRLNLLSETPGLSPRLIRWWVNFEPPPELASNYQAARLDTNLVLEGEVLSVEADIYNFSQTVAESVEVAIFVNANNVTTPLSPVVFPVIPGGAYETITASFPTAGSTGRVDFVFQIDPDGKLNEAFTDNNVFSLPSTVLSDTTAPLFAVTFDGVNVFDNDYVRPEPEIRIGIRDNSPLPITDPNSVVLKLDNRRITLGSTPDSLFETLTGNEKARVTFRPTLAKGNHLLSVQVLDASGNPADSMEYEVRFKVETDLRLLQVFNFPNPFSTET
ncbi:MAG: CARDB domain-containing protein, partial [Bacteroidota bacterium]